MTEHQLDTFVCGTTSSIDHKHMMKLDFDADMIEDSHVTDDNSSDNSSNNIIKLSGNITEHNGFSFDSESEMFIIKSQLLLDFLTNLIDELVGATDNGDEWGSYRGRISRSMVTTTKQGTSVESKLFIKYFHELQDYTNYLDKLESEQVPTFLSEMEDFIKAVKDIHKGEISSYETMSSKGKLQFKFLETHYIIGKHYIYDRFGSNCVGLLKNKYVQMGHQNKILVLTFKTVNYDHKKKNYIYVDYDVYVYEQKKSYEIHTLQYKLATEEQIKSNHDNGKKYIELVKNVHYFEYEGSRYVPVNNGVKQIYSTGRVIIDDEDAYNNFNQYHSDNSACEVVTDLTEETYCLCPTFLTGFSFNHDAGWGYFLINNLKPCVFNEAAFDMLCLDNHKDQKTVIRNLLIAKKTHQYHDIIKNKSSGLVFLLHGPPGTGKTTTAEAVSEILHYPLYKVGFGDLGTNHAFIEENLKRIFDLATRWNAVVLIDEADTIMEARTEMRDYQANSVTSIFLKYIETYDGVIFLTTNRLKTIDPAFESRISINLEYKLTEDMNKETWMNLLKNVKSTNISETEIEDLVRLGLNGRQITNLIKLSYLCNNGDSSKITKQTLNDMYRLAKNKI
jgi:hypothetical protein